VIRLYVDPVTCVTSIHIEGLEGFRQPFGSYLYTLPFDDMANVVVQLEAITARIRELYSIKSQPYCRATPSSPATPPPS